MLENMATDLEDYITSVTLITSKCVNNNMAGYE